MTPFTIKTLRSSVLCLTFLLSWTSAYADDSQFWSILTATGGLGDTKGKVFAEVQPRYDHEGDRVERLLFRGAVGYPIAKGLVGWVGYGWIPAYQTASGDKNFTNEHRAWQQLTYDHSASEVAFSHRLRLEQRLIGDEDQVSNRGRYLLRGSIPLGEVGGAVYGLTAYDEVFVTLHGMHRGPIGGFDRNRYLVGSYLKFDNYRLEAGYLREESRGRGGIGREINAAVLSLGVTF